METIQQYRHIIDNNVRETFEEAAIKVVNRNKPKKLGFIGFIKSPSKQYHHDIDVLLFPAKESKSGEA